MKEVAFRVRRKSQDCVAQAIMCSTHSFPTPTSHTHTSFLLICHGLCIPLNRFNASSSPSSHLTRLMKLEKYIYKNSIRTWRTTVDVEVIKPSAISLPVAAQQLVTLRGMIFMTRETAKLICVFVKKRAFVSVRVCSRYVCQQSICHGACNCNHRDNHKCSIFCN